MLNQPVQGNSYDLSAYSLADIGNVRVLFFKAVIVRVEILVQAKVGTRHKGMRSWA